MRRLSDTVLFNDIVHILVASAREVDEDRALAHFLSQLHTVSHRVCAFKCGDNALFAVLKTCRVIAEIFTSAERFNAVDINRIIQEAREEACSIDSQSEPCAAVNHIIRRIFCLRRQLSDNQCRIGNNKVSLFFISFTFAVLFDLYFTQGFFRTLHRKTILIDVASK